MLKKGSYIKLLLLFLLLFLFNGDMKYSNWQQSCRDWDSFRNSSVKLVNNIWGKMPDHHYQHLQCIYYKNGKYAWSWHWPTERFGVKAYPALLFGKKPWYDNSTYQKLPIQLSQLETASVTFSTQQQHSGRVNLLLEAWLTDSAEAVHYDRTSEIAIHLYQQNWPGQGGHHYGSVIIDDHQYDVYLNHNMKVPGDEHTWSYISFVNTGDAITKATIDFKQFINYALEQKMIIPSEFLSSLEIGNEIDNGNGTTLVTDYQININETK